MDMYVAGAAKLAVFEMVPFEVGETVRHVGLARQERFLPDDIAIAVNPADSLDVVGRRADEELGPKRRPAKLGMREPQIIVPLGHVIAELIGETQAEPARD